jgi:catechol 2,3-dioxygenase-like lactoylglutathione lyase family enzyme
VSTATQVVQLGMVVPNLEQAIGTFGAIGYDLTEVATPVVADGRTLRQATLALSVGPDLVVEELTNERDEPVLPLWGLSSHPCWYVDDMQAAVARLRELGLAGDNRVLDRFGPETGVDSTYIHFLADWGMDLELIASPNGIALYDMDGPARLWDPSRPDTWEGPPPADGHRLSRHGLPTIAGTVHIGFRVPDLQAASDFLIEQFGCRVSFQHATLQRSAGQWNELPPDGEIPPPDRSVPDDRYPAGSLIRIAYLRCTNFNFELIELLMPDESGELKPAFDRKAASIMRPVFKVASLQEAEAELERSGASRDELRPGSPGWLAPWGQSIALVE